ncbi:MAG: hypothetical protein ACK5ZJ_06500, partial [Acidobacteriota bacterium]
ERNCSSGDKANPFGFCHRLTQQAKAPLLPTEEAIERMFPLRVTIPTGQTVGRVRKVNSLLGINDDVVVDCSGVGPRNPCSEPQSCHHDIAG